MRLGIEIHQADAFVVLDKSCPEIRGRGRLADSTLLIYDGYCSHEGIINFGVRVCRFIVSQARKSPELIPLFIDRKSKMRIITSMKKKAPKTTKKIRKVSRQRKATLEQLKNVTTHPTAEELHELVQKCVPRISLATVYRNLQLLVRDGLAMKLAGPGTEARYDGNVEPHYHIRCRSCGRVEDVDMKTISNLESRLQEESSWLVESHRVEFDGICPMCLSMGGKC